VPFFNGLIQLALALLAQFSTTRRVGERLGRAAAAAFLALLALAAIFAAVGCAIAALWLAMIPYAGPVGAPLVAAGALLAAGLILLLAGRLVMRVKPSPPRSSFFSALQAGDIDRLVREHKETLLWLILALGLVLGSGKSEKKSKDK
jgi:hypothetical protein